MIGKELLHYRILEKLGAGGMGTVFLAEDTKLERKVALKFLSSSITKNEEALDRFSKEAKIAASLSHPNIAQVHAIEESEEGTFIVFQYIEGQELQDYIEDNELTEEQCFEIARSIASGLLAAHEEGIIHRDVKAGNIMISTKGHVKILDFGIAGLLEAADFHNTAEQSGTVTYMAPELFVGLPATFQTEIWAFGVVLYQLFSKKLPFDGVYQQAISYSIMHEEHTPIKELVPDIPKALESIITKCLKKDKEERYASFSEVIKELDDYKNQTKTIITEVETGLSSKQRIGIFSLVGVLSAAIIFMIVERVFFASSIDQFGLSVQTASIAVLPFVDMSQDQDQEYFSDGLSEELLNVLTKVEGLKVAGRTSSFQFKGQNLDLRKIGDDLNVEHVLEGSVRKFGDQIRITAQLIKADDGFHIWSETYQRDYSANELFQIQDEISYKVLQELEVRLLPEKELQISKNLTANTEAYNDYLRATQLLANRKAGEIEEAIKLFDQAIEKDPNFAAAYARQAIALNLLYLYGNIERDEMLKQMRRNIDRALLLDSELGWAYAALGEYHKNVDNYEDAEIALRKAHMLIPGDPEIMIWYSEAVDSWEFSEQLIKRAFETDPYSALAIYHHAKVLYDYDEFDEAFDLMEKNLEINPDNSHSLSLRAEFMKDQPFGRLDESFIYAYQAYQLEPGNLTYKFELAEISTDLGFFFLVEQMRDEIEKAFPENFSLRELKYDYFLYTEQYDSARITLEQLSEYMDMEFSNYELFEPVMIMYLNAGWLDEADNYLSTYYPDIAAGDLEYDYYIEDLALSAVLYDKFEKSDIANSLTETTCSVVKNFLSYEGDIEKEIVQDLMDYLDCVALQKNKDLVLDILEEIHFNRGSKANIYTFIDANPLFDFVSEEREYRELRDRMEADIVSMRNNAISWLQERGEWQSDWEIFIPKY